MEESKNHFAMMIPDKPMEVGVLQPDPNGVPIYRGCKSNGPCACTGACQKIIGYDTDSEKVTEYHKRIERHNELLLERLKSFSTHSRIISDDGTTKVWKWTIDNQSK